MTTESGIPPKSFSFYFNTARKLLPGLMLTGVLTALAIWLSSFPGIENLGFGALTLAIICGLIIGHTIFPKISVVCLPGIQIAKQKLLRLGIIMYGFRLTFQQITDIGFSGMVADALTLISTFFLAIWLGKKCLAMDSQTVMLIGAGSSICGAAAVMAVEPVIKAEPGKVVVAVSTVVIFGTLAIFIYPWLYQLNAHFQWININSQNFGVYIGATVHEVAQVVAAGRAINEDIGNAAVITKMIRVMMLAPFLFILSSYLSCTTHQDATQAPSSIVIPWFALLFILVAGFNSFNLLPPAIIDNLITFDTILLAMAMAALGLTSHLSTIQQAGFRPILLASLLFIWLIFGGGLMSYGVTHWFSLSH